jgi:hypothetical protein
MSWRVLLVTLCLWALTSPADAVEYRLQVVSLYQGAFAHFLNGSIGRGEGELVLGRLERSLDRGEFPWGALLYDRMVQEAGESLSAAFGAAAVRATLRRAEGARRWDEVVWEGTPGGRSLWVIGAPVTHQQEVVHVGLKGNDALRYYIPYRVAWRRARAVVSAYPLEFLRFHAERGALWERYLAGAVNLQDGIAGVVGVNPTPSYGDWVYILVEHPPTPATFKVVIGWEQRPKLQDTSPNFRE